MDRFLIVGLGNPGFEYENTKHNVGFKCIDSLCETLNIKLDNNKFNGLYSIFSKNGDQYFIAKPQTYMNNSGFFVSEIVKFYKINISNIIVIYDDIDTEIGKIRLRQKGSSGGQNGMKNIINLLSTDEIKRIRIGIGKPKGDLAKYVLSRFSIQEILDVQLAINKSKDALIDVINGNNFDKVMNKYN